MAHFDQASVVVLLVEDEGIVRMSTASKIADAGFAVVEAENADAAVSILESRADVRIVFTDVDMPGSMDGLRLAAAVRSRWPSIEIVVTSGYRHIRPADLPRRSLFLAKPYSGHEVITALRQLAA
jgi:two-component system, response regulator PdtaR